MGLHIDKLSASSKGEKYLDRITLSVPAGQACALVGKGSEKRLLLRLVRECIRKNITLIENDDVVARIDSGEGILVIEGDNLFDFMTVKQYLLYNAGAINMAKSEKLLRIEDCLNIVGLNGFLDKKISVLNRIDKCLIGIASGLFAYPDVLLLCLDGLSYSSATYERINKCISNIKSRGVAVLVTLNDSRLVGEGFDILGLIKSGKILEIGAIPDIVAKYGCAVYSVKTDKASIKALTQKFNSLKSVIKVLPRGNKIYLYTLDKERTSREMLVAIGEESSISELNFTSSGIEHLNKVV